MYSSVLARSMALLFLLLPLYGAHAGGAPEQDAQKPSAAGAASAASPDFRGVYFNPQVKAGEADFPWLCFYPEYRSSIRTALTELVHASGINLVDIFVCIAYSLKTPAIAPKADQPITEWGNMAYLDGLVSFINDCQEAGLQVELDLANNLWVPYSADPKHQIGNSGYWPLPDETPWDEAANWYREVISYVEGRVKCPETIALWSMMGNYELGTAEPCLWDREDNPALLKYTEEFVKRVWPVFRASGHRPKAPPILLPILADGPYWREKTPQARLGAFTHMKQWLIDDLRLPPDYWVMTTYPFCDPAQDGFSYLKAIVGILGRENASRIISTDLKGPGHDDVRDCIVSVEGHSGPETLQWHFRQCASYGFAGWWIWAYQDTPAAQNGIRTVSGQWKEDLLQAIRERAPHPEAAGAPANTP